MKRHPILSACCVLLVMGCLFQARLAEADKLADKDNRPVQPKFELKIAPETSLEELRKAIGKLPRGVRVTFGADGEQRQTDARPTGLDKLAFVKKAMQAILGDKEEAMNVKAKVAVVEMEAKVRMDGVTQHVKKVLDGVTQHMKGLEDRNRRLIKDCERNSVDYLDVYEFPWPYPP